VIMARSEIVKASAGSGKTYNLTERVYSLLKEKNPFILAVTFTKAATAEMRKRILDRIDSEDIGYGEKLSFIMKAGRVNFSTFDSFFYLLLAAGDEYRTIADEKEAEIMKSTIEKRFFKEVHTAEKVEELIISTRILRTTLENLASELKSVSSNRAAKISVTKSEFKSHIERTSTLKNEIKLLQVKLRLLDSEKISKNCKKGVISLSELDPKSFSTKKALQHSDLAEYGWLGKKIDWGSSPYFEINEVFKELRALFAEYLIHRAVLKEITILNMFSVYNLVADKVKDRERRIFFEDVLEKLIELDGRESDFRGELTNLYYELGFNRIKHLLIDEFQDTSRDNIALLWPLLEELLSEVDERGRGERSVFIVGDWKQMIYAWRGADREAVEEKLKQYDQRQLQSRDLSYNWRSTPLLIRFFNTVVENIFTGPEMSETQEAPEVKSYSGHSEINLHRVKSVRNSKDSLYSAIVDSVKEKREEWSCDYSDITILFRTNTEKEALAAALAENGIGFSEVKGRQILASEEGVALFFFLLSIFGREKDFPFAALAVSLSSYGEKLDRYLSDRENIVKKYAFPHGLKAVSDVLESVRANFPDSVIDVYRDEAEFFFKEKGDDVAQFLSYIFKIRRKIAVPEPVHSDRVKLATIHASKGLEFKHVLLLWFEGSSPLSFYLPPLKSSVSFNKKEIEFFSTLDSENASLITSHYDEAVRKSESEKSNIFYVAVTRATETVSIFVKDGSSQPLTEKIVSLFEDGFSGMSSETERVISFYEDYPEIEEESQAQKNILPLVKLQIPDDVELIVKNDIDPAFISQNIEEGIARGERIHNVLSKIHNELQLYYINELDGEDYKSVNNFISSREVREIMFRSGKIFTEQSISSRKLFGIVDRMIIAEEKITIVDYKTGSSEELIEKYQEQLSRYVEIMQTLYPGRAIDAYLLFIDTPGKVLKL